MDVVHTARVECWMPLRGLTYTGKQNSEPKSVTS